jgi:hypothetical protein
VLALVAVVSAVSILAWLHTRATGDGGGGPCVSVVIPSTMGGATIKRCGAAAQRFCRENTRDAQIASACRREGFPA